METTEKRFTFTTEQLATALADVGMVNWRDFANQDISADALAEHMAGYLDPLLSLPLAVRAPEVAAIFAEIRAMITDYSDPERDVIASMPFAASLSQLALEKYGVDF